jgi:alanyl aminopeptidase
MAELRICSAALLAAVAAVTACATPTGDASALRFAADGMPLGRLATNIAPTRYGLELRIDPSEERFSGVAVIGVTLQRPMTEIWMHGLGLEVSDLRLIRPDGHEIVGTWEQKNDTGSVLITLSEAAPRGPANLKITYSAPFDTSSDGLFRQEREGRWYAATQFEPISARKVFPSFDEPSFKIPFDVAITARSGDVVLTNTPETAAEDLGDGWMRRTYAPTDPLPTYLIAFAVGPYDLVDWGAIPPNAVRSEPLPLRAIAVSGLGGRLQYALDNTPPLVDWLEGYFGRPYPYEKLDLVAMPSSFGGAMENAALLTYDEFLLLMDESSPLAQRRAYTYVHAHEIAHMWFGDLVTPAWWDDIWLNEAFASWMMYKTSDAVWPEGEFDHAMLKDALGAMAEDSLAAARQIREPVTLDSAIADTFDGITYDKGGGVIAMMEAYVGEDAFRDGVRIYINRFADGSATSDDFMDAIAEASGDREIVPAFRSFLDQPGVPLVEARLSCEPGEAPRVSLSQSRYRPLGSVIEADGQSWRIPVCIAHDGGKSCEMLSRPEQTVMLDAQSCPRSIHPNADGAGYYRFALDDAGWTALAADAASLSPSEALAAVDSLDAAFRAGATSADAYVSGMAALAGHPAWDVVAAVADSFELATDILSPEALDAAKPKLAALFRGRYAALGDATEGGDLLLRADLARFLALVAEDPETRGALTAAAAERIGVRPVTDWSHVQPDLLETVISVGVQELDPRFFDLVLGEALASQDPQLRGDAFGALARVEDPVLSERLRTALLAGGFRGPEALGVVQRQLVRPATKDATWAWVKTHGDEVVEMAPGSFRSQAIPGLGAGFCSEAEKQELQSFVAERAAALPGYERSLAQVEERISLCAAFKDAESPALAAALARLPG